MRKRLIHGLGALALVLGGPPAVGQEKPAVLPQTPGVWRIRVQAEDLARDLKIHVQAQDQGRAVLPLPGEWLAFAADGVFIRDTKTFQPLMKGDLALAVAEMEKAVQVIPDADLREGLAALGTAERAAMKARRLLPAQKEGVEESSEGDEESSSSRWITFTSSRGGTVQRWVVRGGGDLVFHGAVRAQRQDRTPTQEAQDSLQQAVASLRQAGDREEARVALDEMDQSVTALRVLLWEKQAAKSR